MVNLIFNSAEYAAPRLPGHLAEERASGGLRIERKLEIIDLNGTLVCILITEFVH